MNFSIQLKAALLLLVFTINTLSGFACAMGVNMGFSFPQNAVQNQTKVQVVHKEKTCHSKPDETSKQPEGKNDHNGETGGRNCCGDKMIQFDKLDKSVVKSFSITPVFLSLFVSAFYDVDGSFRSPSPANIKTSVRSFHLPIPDIRIAIRSFQV